MLETLIAAVMLASLILYALMGGADYGGGMWDLLASGPRAQRQRHAIVEAIAPIWEANHVWLILVIVLLFSGFPRAFSVTMIALDIPVTAMLIGAAPESTLKLLLLALGAGTVVLLPSLFYLFQIFKGQEQR
jgi:cytochrome bd ubiquinol oxidase subunit II